MLVTSFMIRHFYYYSALMRLTDDDITPHNSSWSAASTKELRKESVCERDKMWTRTIRKATQPTEREREREREKELGIFFMVRIDSTTSRNLVAVESILTMKNIPSSFGNHIENWKVQNLKGKFPDFAVKIVQTNFFDEQDNSFPEKFLKN